MSRRREHDAGSIRALPSGRFQARIRFEGRRISAPVTFETRGDAAAWLALASKTIKRGTFVPQERSSRATRAVPPAVLTLRRYAAQWLTERDLKPRTRYDYQALLDHWILPVFEDMALEDITPAAVRTWHADLAPGRDTTRAHAYGLLRTILHTAAADDLIPSNPCRVRGAGNTKRQSRTVVPTTAEVETIATAMPERLRALIWLAAWTGLRYGEITELRRKDISPDGSLVSVRRAVVRVGGAHVVGVPKSAAGIRDVAVPPHMVPMLLDHLERFTGRDGDALLFPSDSGAHLATTTFYGCFFPARKVAARTDLRFHDLRHLQGTLAAQSGATLAELMARLGHSTVTASLKYQHAVAERDRAIAEALSEHAGGPVPLRVVGEDD